VRAPPETSRAITLTSEGRYLHTWQANVPAGGSVYCSTRGRALSAGEGDNLLRVRSSRGATHQMETGGAAAASSSSTKSGRVGGGVSGAPPRQVANPNKLRNGRTGGRGRAAEVGGRGRGAEAGVSAPRSSGHGSETTRAPARTEQLQQPQPHTGSNSGAYTDMVAGGGTSTGDAGGGGGGDRNRLRVEAAMVSWRSSFRVKLGTLGVHRRTH